MATARGPGDETDAVAGRAYNGALGTLGGLPAKEDRQGGRALAGAPSGRTVVESRLTSVVRMVEVKVMSGAVDDFERCAASRIYPVYWQEFWRRADEYDGAVIFNVRGRPVPSKGWIRLVNTGIGGIFFSAVASVDGRKVEADFTLENASLSAEKFAVLKTHQDDIERSFGRKLCWEVSPTSKNDKRRVFLRKNNVSLRERHEWRSQHDWLIHHVVKLYLAIKGTNTI